VRYFVVMPVAGFGELALVIGLQPFPVFLGRLQPRIVVVAYLHEPMLPENLGFVPFLFVLADSLTANLPR